MSERRCIECGADISTRYALVRICSKACARKRSLALKREGRALVGAQAKYVERSKIGWHVAGEVKSAVTQLASMPQPRDAVEAILGIQGNVKSTWQAIRDNLPKAVYWLMEFVDEWESRDPKKGTAPAPNGDAHTRDGDQSSGSEPAQPPPL